MSLEIIEAFNESAIEYEKWYEEPLGRYVLDAELMVLDRLIPLQGLGIDIGAGTGIFAKHLISSQRRIICLDPAIEMIKQAKDKGLDVIVGVIELAPIREKAFDFGYMVATLEFIKNPLEALRSVKNIIKDHGLFVLMIINRCSPWGESYIKAGKEGHPIFKHANFLSLSEAIEYLEKAGIKVKEVWGTLKDPPTIVPKEKPKLYSPKEMPSCGVFFISVLVL